MINFMLQLNKANTSRIDVAFGAMHMRSSHDVVSI